MKLIGHGALIIHLCPLSPHYQTKMRIDDYIRAAMTKNQIPGLSVAVVQEGEPVLIKGYGLANVEHYVPATEHTVYEIASVAKTFTATVIMMLVEQGVISLEEAIAKKIAEYYCPVLTELVLQPPLGEKE